MKEITKEQFARLSFERDFEAGCYDGEDVPESWEELQEEDKAPYIGEAIYYLSRPQEEWPVDILERL